MQSYILTFIVQSQKSSSEQAKKIGQIVTDLKGKIVKEDFLGKKKMAYAIKKTTDGDYYQLEFQLEQVMLPDLRKELKQKELALRFLLMQKAKN
jgi:small subunit ribosomal protein S6